MLAMRAFKTRVPTGRINLCILLSPWNRPSKLRVVSFSKGTPKYILVFRDGDKPPHRWITRKNNNNNSNEKTQTRILSWRTQTNSSPKCWCCGLKGAMCRAPFPCAVPQQPCARRRAIIRLAACSAALPACEPQRACAGFCMCLPLIGGRGCCLPVW